MSRDVIAYINFSALRHNFKLLKSKLAENTSVLAMIKANAYGHGAVQVAKQLTGADAFGVACVEEALNLIDSGIQTPLMVMSGFLDEAELSLFSKHNLISVLHDESQLMLLEKKALSRPLTVWLKYDSGMHRLGFLPEDMPKLMDRLQNIPWVKKPLGLMTHLADADNSATQYTQEQMARFFRMANNYACPKSIAHSAAIFAYPEAHADWVRPGIMLYGVSPFQDRCGADLGLKPVMTLTAKLIVIKQLKKHDRIGYGCTWSCPEDMPVGIVALGYGDGYPRHAPSLTPTLVRGKICPLVGRVSMDLITIDLRAVPEAKVGDCVTLWGDGLPVETIAKKAGTIGYELLCHLTKRVKFREISRE